MIRQGPQLFNILICDRSIHKLNVDKHTDDQKTIRKGKEEKEIEHRAVHINSLIYFFI